MAAPRFSVVIPCYRSEGTLPTCLEGLRRQTRDDRELIFVDSSPDDRGADYLARQPDVLLIRSTTRLWMHAARNRGAREAKGEILVFTDPDCIPDPTWLDEIDATVRAGHDAVIGSVGFGGRGVVETAAHFCKFWLWLPGASEGPAIGSPSGNFSVTRAAFEGAGGFSEDYLSADTLLGDALRARGASIRFNPRARVRHVDDTTFGRFFRERRRRGTDFARMRSVATGWNRALSALLVVGSPLLVVSHTGRVLGRARTEADPLLLAQCLPTVAAGELAWMIGQVEGCAAHLLGRRFIPLREIA